ncbi:MAG: HAD hydrolase-like protein [Planctomycetes bacterium]|nr:HAD hydrolase-like protein [Planctomycetota bacterium]
MKDQLADVSAVLFDLDGTLTDPREGITRCIRHALEKLGRDSPPDSELFRFIGPPLREAFASILGPADRDLIEKAVALYRERFASIGILENQVYPGIPALLVRLRELQYRLLVATSKPIVYAERILEHFGIARHFEAVYGPDLDGNHDDKSEMVRFLVREERLEPANTALVGDRKHDMLAARENGLIAIGVAYGFGTEAELASAGAWTVARSPTAVLSLFERARLEQGPAAAS